jgi:hypothetical protein
VVQWRTILTIVIKFLVLWNTTEVIVSGKAMLYAVSTKRIKLSPPIGL